jgi:hypothetical protein
MRGKLKPLLALLAFGLFTLSGACADEDWQEAEAPPPPAWSKDGLIAIDMPIRTSLYFGIDPKSLSIGPDWVVRYVVVAYNPGGSTNAIYEGLRCDTAEVKTYARASEPGKWSLISNPIWRPLDVTQSATRHSLALARQGLCESSATGGRTPAELVRRLQAPR